MQVRVEWLVRKQVLIKASLFSAGGVTEVAWCKKQKAYSTTLKPMVNVSAAIL